MKSGLINQSTYLQSGNSLSLLVVPMLVFSFICAKMEGGHGHGKTDDGRTRTTNVHDLAYLVIACCKDRATGGDKVRNRDLPILG